MSKKTKAPALQPVTSKEGETWTEETETIQVDLPPDLKEWAERYTYDLGWTISDLVRGLLELEHQREHKVWTTTVEKGGAK